MVLRTFSPADMLYFDYNSDKMTATLKVPEGKVNAGSKVEVMILFGGSSGDVYYAPSLDVIDKSDNPLNVKGRIAKVKYKKLKKKNQYLAVSKVITFINDGQGTKTYSLMSAKKGKKSFKKYFKVNASTGKITVKKKLKKGTYTVKVKVKANGNDFYKESAYQTATIKIIVK